MERVNGLFGEDFEFINTGASHGEFNMEFDESRVKKISLGSAAPMLRVYGWSPWCVSLGANQKISSIDEKICSEKNFSIVRRATGGRAVFHADELTYSIVLKIPEGKNIHDVYRISHEFLLRALHPLCGDKLEFEKSQPDFRGNYKNFLPNVSCFASSARYEILFKGKKVVGSAQRVYGDILLQHGSILLDGGHEQLADVVKFEDESQRKIFRQSLLEKSATLSEAAERKISFDECAAAIFAQFEKEKFSV